MDIAEIAFHESFGLPRPDWARFGEWVEAQPPSADRNAIWTEPARRWLVELGRALGSEYSVEESVSLILLSSLEKRLARTLLEVGERTRESLLEVMGELGTGKRKGKLGCIAFGSTDAYYGYVSHFWPEGDWGASGGCYLAEGYTHFALNHSEARDREAAFVHELTHAVVNERRLPLWVEEGITQFVEYSVIPRDFLWNLNRREADRQRRYWRRHGLEGFWTGESFFRPRSMDHSYSLARILITNMIGRGKEKYMEFVKAARREDAGDAASRAVYGRGVDEWARHFLGDGGWTPRPIEEEGTGATEATSHAG